jgi:protein-disulfide isomerase
VRFTFRHFPLATVHPHARQAAEAAESAAAQGKFWEMHETLFRHQDTLDVDSILTYAGSLDLDVSRFLRELLGGMHASRVQEDFLSGVRSGVNGTPTFFVNGRRHEGDWSLESLGLAIGNELKRRSQPRSAAGVHART